VSADTQGIKKKKRPRSCVGCGCESPKRELLRVVRTPEGEVKFDPTGRANGRGVYVCRNLGCVMKARKKKALSRMLKTQVEDSVYDELDAACGEMRFND